jgi:hypothetical protein
MSQNKRLLVTLSQRVVDLLEEGVEVTNLTKSQLITLCVNRGLKSVIDEYEVK